MIDYDAGAAKDEPTLKQPPTRYAKKLLVMCETVAGLNKLTDHVQNGLSSPVLQTVLLVSKTLGPDKHRTIVQTMLQNADVFRISGENE